MSGLLSLENVTKCFGGLTANQNISFTVDARRNHRPHRSQRRGEIDSL